jgi:hypothetical protein
MYKSSHAPSEDLSFSSLHGTSIISNIDTVGGCCIVSGAVISVLIYQCLLSEVEGLKVLATVAVTAIYQPKEAALG